MSGTALAWLVGLATLAGLDLVSVLQGLWSRPLVVGTGSGLLVGDVETGLRVGALLELFALDVVPVGAARYPDFGAATAAAVLYAAGGEWTATLGAASGIGLALAIAAGATIPAVRRWNARTVRRHGERLAAGDPAAVRGVHLACLGHDATRSLGLAAAWIGIAGLLRAFHLRPDPELGGLLSTVCLGGGVWSAAHGATISAPGGGRRAVAAAGLAMGVVLVVV
jgi:PTS system mannose-specific IIC component